MLQELKHPNIVLLKDVMIDPIKKQLSLVFEYAEYDLFAIIRAHHKARQVLTEAAVKSFLWQILNGINYLHLNWIIHRDLKPSNILVMGEGAPQPGAVKIADFGLARVFQSPLMDLSKNGVVVTIWYRAPEILLGAKHYTRAIDIWAIGCIFAELLINIAIFQGNEDHDQRSFQADQLEKIFEVLGTAAFQKWTEAKELQNYDKIKNRNYERKLRNKIVRPTEPLTANGFDLLQRMLEYDPAVRITASDALDHVYFQEKPVPVINSLSCISINITP
uniref:Protein kinase domain-containing protein n=1 Tax=Arcella intermedia TaxID=1963864 RepID=A0A6B2L9B9_9EUKA